MKEEIHMILVSNFELVMYACVVKGAY